MTEREETMYVIETVDGTEVVAYAGTLAEATRAAVSRLEDDPELGTLHVYEIGRERPAGEHVKTITHAPDAHWNTEIVVLDAGESIQPPDDTWKRDREADAYELSDPKHPRHHEVMSEVRDNRSGK